jgi:hypothetical protein
VDVGNQRDLSDPFVEVEQWLCQSGSNRMYSTGDNFGDEGRPRSGAPLSARTEAGLLSWPLCGVRNIERCVEQLARRFNKAPEFRPRPAFRVFELRGLLDKMST